MRFPISLPIRCGWLASIRTRGLPTFLSPRRSVTKPNVENRLRRAEARDEVRLLASRLRRVAAQRGKRKHGSKLDIRETACPAERTDWLRLDADCRAQSQRYQRRRSAFARCVVHGGGAGRGDGADRIDGGGAADVSSARAAGEAGGQHRSDQQWPAHAECGFFLVGGRSAQVWRVIRTA